MFKGNILQIENYIITPKIKNNFPYLTHLKLGALIYLVEIDMSNIVSSYTLNKFSYIINKRKDERMIIKKEEDHYDYIIQKEIEKDNKIKDKIQLCYNYNYSMLNNNNNDYDKYKFLDEKVDKDKKEIETINNNSENNTVKTNIIKEKNLLNINSLLEGKSYEELINDEKKKIESLKKAELINSKEEFPNLQDINENKNINNSKTYNYKSKKKKRKFIEL